MIISITMYLPIWSQGVLGKNATEAGLILMPILLCGHLALFSLVT